MDSDDKKPKFGVYIIYVLSGQRLIHKSPIYLFCVLLFHHI